LVVVRIGKYAGSAPGEAALTKALRLLMDAVPANGGASK
jgi:hypothetical protein